MKAKEFVERVRDEVLEANVAHYATMLDTPPGQVRDPAVRATVTAYQRMDDAQKEAVRLLMRQAVVDTISNLFGIVDGSSLLVGFRDDFRLTYGPSQEELGGELQDAFLNGKT